MGPIVAILLRLLIPLSIFRWPFWGAIASMIADTLDVLIVYFLGSESIPILDNIYQNHYHHLDKYLDTYYLTIELVVSLRWQNHLAKTTSWILYSIRIVGVALFEITSIRWILFFTPNLFEYFFVTYTGLPKWNPAWQLNKKRLVIILLLLLTIKLPHEYLLHVKIIQPGNMFKRWYESHFSFEYHKLLTSQNKPQL